MGCDRDHAAAGGIDAGEGNDPAGDRGVDVERQVLALEKHVGLRGAEPQRRGRDEQLDSAARHGVKQPAKCSATLFGRQREDGVDGIEHLFPPEVIGRAPVVGIDEVELPQL